MKRVRRFRHWSISAIVPFACFAFGAMGCGSDDEAASPAASNVVQMPAAPAQPANKTLYERLGKASGIRTALGAIVTEELKDAEIARFFGNIGSAGHPSAEQLIECLTLQLSSAAGGPEMYPGTAATAKGFQCRSMEAAHAGLNIDSATFDKFVTTAAGVLKSAGVADADIAVIGSVLNSTKSSIVGK